MVEIEGLWIGEEKPDLFSTLIQIYLTMQSRKGFWAKAMAIYDWFFRRHLCIDYSHNAFIYKGRLWHATTPGGVCDCAPEDELKGSIIRMRKTIPLNVHPERFEGWLDGERGKGYCAIPKIFTRIKFLRDWYSNGNAKRDCSEFFARACLWSEYVFPRDLDRVSPLHTARVIKPNRVP